MNENSLSKEQIKEIKSKIKKLFINELDNLEVDRLTLSYNVLEIKLNTIVEIIVLKMKLNNHIQLDSKIFSLLVETEEKNEK